MDAQTKLEKAIEVVTRAVQEDSNFSHVNETILFKIIVNESSKSFLTKEVDHENKEGYFEIYKRIILRIEEIIMAYAPSYKFSLTLASTMIEGALHQRFLNEHFPTITNCNERTTPTQFFNELVFKTIN